MNQNSNSWTSHYILKSSVSTQSPRDRDREFTCPVHWKQPKSRTPNKLNMTWNWNILIREGRLLGIAVHYWNPTPQFFNKLVSRRVKWAQFSRHLAGKDKKMASRSSFPTFLEAASSATSPGPRAPVSTYESARVLMTITSLVKGFLFLPGNQVKTIRAFAIILWQCG